jgi:hypothetical protein
VKACMHGTLDHLPCIGENFEITLNLEIKNALFSSMVIIVQFILGPNCVIIES